MRKLLLVFGLSIVAFAGGDLRARATANVLGAPSRTTLEEHTFVAKDVQPRAVPQAGPSTQMGRSGASLRIYPDAQVLLGSGYSTLAGTPRNNAIVTAVSQSAPPALTTTQDLEIDYDFKLVESYEDLARSLSIDAAASYRGITGGASARFNLYRSSRMTSRSVYVLVRMSIMSGVT